MTVSESRRTELRMHQEEQLVQLVVRHVFREMVGRPADQVYRVLSSRLYAAEVRPPEVAVHQLAREISDGSYQLLR